MSERVDDRALDRLDDLAGKATPGPWHDVSLTQRIEPPEKLYLYAVHRYAADPGGYVEVLRSRMSGHDVPYIAACDPAAIRALVAEIRKARAVVGAAREYVENAKLLTQLQLCKALREYDSLEAYDEAAR